MTATTRAANPWKKYPKVDPDLPEVKVGQKIYVETRWYIDRGEDDILGGVATVSKVTVTAHGDVFVEVKEIPNRGLGWSHLAGKQKKLKAEYGRRKARPDPDLG